MTTGQQLKEQLNNMSEEELNLFSAYVLTNKNVVEDVLSDVAFDISTVRRDREIDVQEVKKVLSAEAVKKLIEDEWYRAHKDEEDPYGFFGSWDTFISAINNVIYEAAGAKLSEHAGDNICETCHGTGYIKSYCDEPDKRCHYCNGTGEKEV